MNDEIEIQQVNFEPDALIVGYMLRSDVRVEGSVIMQRTVRLDSAHPDYGVDIERLHDRVLKVLANALEDWEESVPYAPAEAEDPDDERGMGE